MSIVTARDRATGRIESKNIPSLRILSLGKRTLSLEYISPEIPVPLSGITDLIYKTRLPVLSQQPEEILYKLPDLRRLRLEFREVEDTTLRIRLPPLISLNLVSDCDVPFAAFRRFTVTFPSPNLQSLTHRPHLKGIGANVMITS